MRHSNSGKRLGRNSSHRHALWGNLVTALVTNGRIETTHAKAKELRRFAEDAVGWGKSVHELIAKGDKMTPSERGKVIHAKRMAKQFIKTPEALRRLFDEIGPHFATRPGGYTRVLKTRNRVGDAAPMAFVELVGLAPAIG